MRECVCIFLGLSKMRSLVGGVVFRGGGIGKRECPVEDIKVRALVQDMYALAG